MKRSLSKMLTYPSRDFNNLYYQALSVDLTYFKKFLHTHYTYSHKWNNSEALLLKEYNGHKLF